MRVALCSGHLHSVALAYADGDVLTDQGERLVVDEFPAITIHCIPPHPKPTKRFDTIGNTLRGILDGLRNRFLPALRPNGFLPEDRLVLALPGVATKRDFKNARGCVAASGSPISPANVHVIDDTFAGLIAASQSTQGICAFAGAGASVYMGTPSGEFRRSTDTCKPFKRDGFGPMLGDHGSGFELAMSALRKIFRHLDELQQQPAGVSDGSGDVAASSATTELMEELIRRCGRKQEDDDENVLQVWFEELLAERPLDWRAGIVDLAIPITLMAENGNLAAKGLVKTVAEGLVETVKTALRLDDFDEMGSATIYCQGRMFWHSREYYDTVKTMLKNYKPGNPVKMAPYKPIVGALLVAAAPDWTVPSSTERRKIVDEINSIPPSDKRHEFLHNRDWDAHAAP